VYSFTTPIGVVKLYKVSIVQAKWGRDERKGKEGGREREWQGKGRRKGKGEGKGRRSHTYFARN